ncbi:putative enoyl-[acyl-carrier-protein] reductaseII [Tannerella forsythia KS16]|mgnify:FL=1|uniref:Nitronate monooxygenase n=2 Tax=Tannerella forsythia TaxID=28112 RepID=A0A1D3UTU8_TANFO|nr:nitronate monooxygenase [Tannerella forsythia]AEW21229.1 putative enoyl-[acyl-carrier-protein] reductase II [Tannerella forsythia 92A2]KKY60881.1 2-nitropropane dioxygenase [Tannerella forsythia]OLQ21815.1 2-nitropropane dioxygenase [Tannerella forsythia]PDP43137.1 nitronate monooxygenase [Tannerella forsythia]PDP71624.1 nitronate monooxygenase [Tannerella forsythia]
MNRITKLFGIRYPMISGGMVWCSGWRLASAVSNHGGLGLLGAGSMHPETLEEHIRKMHRATDKPWGINVPLLYPEMDRIIEIILREKVKIVFTSAGSPKKWTPLLQRNKIKVVHVVSSTAFARKCEEAGCDAVVAEGFEAGGHNGREETTTLTLIPQVRRAVSLPLIAAGGIASGRGMLAAMALGAEGVQIGTRFALSEESSAHERFKQKCITLDEGDTILSLKKLSPTRLIRNEFYRQVEQAENAGASAEEIAQLLGRGRAKRGIFEGELDEGELEIGQAASMIRTVEPVGQIMAQMIAEYNAAADGLTEIRF